MHASIHTFMAQHTGKKEQNKERKKSRLQIRNVHIKLFRRFGCYTICTFRRMYANSITTCVERILQSRKLESEQGQRKHQKKWGMGAGTGV